MRRTENGKRRLTNSSLERTAPKIRFTTSMPEFGEIYVCRFPFTSGTFSKPRPVLVLFVLEVDVVICRITSVFYSGPLDVELQSWSAAGLEKPSVARLNRLFT